MASLPVAQVLELEPFLFYPLNGHYTSTYNVV